LAITVPKTLATPETAAFTINTSTSTFPAAAQPMAHPLILVGVVARCLRILYFGLPLLETHSGPVVNHQSRVDGHAIVATEGTAPSLRAATTGCVASAGATPIASITAITESIAKIRLMYSPNVVAIPAGSPHQNRKALSDSADRTDEQDLALDEQDLAVCPTIWRDRGR
jgi:hypothetical protein